MFTFIAGATTTGPVDARYKVVRKSSATPRANFAMMSAVAGATRRRSVRCATAMCSMALSRLASPPEESLKRSVMTFWALRAAKVSGVTNSRAAVVITTCTLCPSCWRRRTSSAALYAATPPVTPNVIRIQLFPRRYFFLLLPSLSSSTEVASEKSNSSKPWSSSSQATRVAFCVLGFSIMGGAPAMIWRARLAASTTYANWLSGALLCTVISVLLPKRCQKFLYLIPSPRAGAAQSGHNRLRFASCALHIFIHDAKIIILAKNGDFIPRLGKPPRNLVIGILPTAAQAALQFFPRRRKDKDSHGFWQLFLDLRRSLDVNLQNKVESSLTRFLQPLLRRAVGMFSEDPGVLEKLAARHHGVEFRLCNEIITFPARLRRAARPCSTGNRRHGSRQLENPLHQRGFAGAGWPRDNQNQRCARSLGAHSMFCTCSRSFSISALISSANPVIARASLSTPGVLESIVFASRCIS